MSALTQILPPEVVWRLGWTLIHFIWEGAAIAGAAAIVLLLLRRRSASVRYLVACSALGLMPCAAIGTFIVLEPGRAAAPEPAASFTAPTDSSLSGFATLSAAHESGALELEPAPEPTAPEPMQSSVERDGAPVRTDEILQALARACEPHLPVLVLGWGLGMFVLSLRLVGGWAQVQRLRRVSTASAGENLEDLLTGLAGRLGVARSVRLLHSTIASVPVTIGWLRPVVLLPVSAVTQLSEEQLRAILAHELAHIRRYDYLANLLQSVVEVLLFYHPCVWWLSRRIRMEREHCCDDLAVSTSDRIVYARALARMEEIRHHGVSLAAAVTGGSLVRRIRRLLGVPEHRRAGSWLAGSIGLALFSVVVMTMQLASDRPSLAGESPDEPAPGAVSLPLGAGNTAQPTVEVGAATTAPAPEAMHEIDLNAEQIAERFLRAIVPGEQFTAEWQEESKPTAMYWGRPASAPAGLPRAEVALPLKTRHTIEVNGAKSRLESEQVSLTPGEDRPDRTTYTTAVFDGKLYRAWHHSASGAGGQGSEWTEDDVRNVMFRSLIHRWMPVTPAAMSRCRLSMVPSGGSDSLVLRIATYSTGFYLLTLDATRACLPVRAEYYAAGPEQTGRPTPFRVSEYELAMLDGGWYISGRADYERARPSGALELAGRVKVTKLARRAAAPEERFSLDFPQGTKVYYAILQERRTVGTDTTPTAKDYEKFAETGLPRGGLSYPITEDQGRLRARRWGADASAAWEPLPMVEGRPRVDAGQEVLLEVNPDAIDFFFLASEHATAIDALSLVSCTMDDVQLRFVGGMKNLRWLDLRGTRVTDRGLGFLAGLPRLRHVDLRDTQVTPAGVAMLKTNLPQCTVVNARKPDVAQNSASEAPAVRPSASRPADDTGSAMVQVFQFRHAKAVDVAVNLQEAFRHDAGIRHIECSEVTNALVVVGTREGIERLKHVLEELDRPPALERVVRVVHLRHVPAERVVQMLRSLYPSSDLKNTVTAEPGPNPDTLLLSYDASQEQRMMGLIQLLDQPGTSPPIATQPARSAALLPRPARTRQEVSEELGEVRDALNLLQKSQDPDRNSWTTPAVKALQARMTQLTEELASAAGHVGPTLRPAAIPKHQMTKVYLIPERPEEIAAELQGALLTQWGSDAPEVKAVPSTKSLIVTGAQEHFASVEEWLHRIRKTKESGASAEAQVMSGTWWFDNPEGDDEQMAIYPDGRVVLLYSNGRRDETRLVDGSIELAEYKNLRTQLTYLPDGTLLQRSDAARGLAKLWTRVDTKPRNELLRPLSGEPATEPATRPASTQPSGRSAAPAGDIEISQTVAKLREREQAILNLELEAESRTFSAPYTGGQAGTPVLVETADVRHKRIGDSFIQHRTAWHSGDDQPLSRRTCGYDASEAIARSVTFFRDTPGVPQAEMSRSRQAGLQLDDYLLFLSGPVSGGHTAFSTYLLSHEQHLVYEGAAPGSREIIIQVGEWYGPDGKPHGIRRVWLDPARDFLITRVELRWDRGRDWAERTAEVLDASQVDGVWMPTSIRTTVRMSVSQDVIGIRETRISEVSLGKVRQDDLQVPFPPNAQVTDRIAGTAYRLGSDGQVLAGSRRELPSESSAVPAAQRDMLRGVILQPDGRPAEGAQVCIAGEDSTLLHNGTRLIARSGNQVDTGRSAAAGEFTVRKMKRPFLLLVTHDTGYAEVTDEEFAKSSRVELRAWGRIEGLARAGARPVAGEKIVLTRHRWIIDTSLRMAFTGVSHTPRFELVLETSTDDEGRFGFDRVPPMAVRLARQRATPDGGLSEAAAAGIAVQPGQTEQLTLGGPGRTVTGRLLAPGGTRDAIDWARATGSARAQAAPLPLFPTKAQRQKWDEEFQQLPAFGMAVDQEGRFRIEDVPDGPYELGVLLRLGEQSPDASSPVRIATARHTFTVSSSDAGPLDLGEVQLKLQ